jgi:hypothetical protein
MPFMGGVPTADYCMGLSEKFEKLVRTASLAQHLRTVSTKREQM